MRKNINRTTVIIVLAIFLTLSVGYALFSDTITIEGTATAQGKFDIVATCQLGISDGIEIGFRFAEEKGYGNDPSKNWCSVNENNITYSVELLHFNSIRYVTTKFTNEGTITAVYDINSFSPKYKLCSDGYNGDLDGLFNDSECKIIDGSDIILAGFEDEEGQIYSGEQLQQEEILSKFVDLETGAVTLKPNESIYYVFLNTILTKGNEDMFNASNFNVIQQVNVSFEFNQKTN